MKKRADRDAGSGNVFADIGLLNRSSEHHVITLKLYAIFQKVSLPRQT